ncbi:hypothetical protein OROGR_018975 [Orobanche gracilis]
METTLSISPRPSPSPSPSPSPTANLHPTCRLSLRRNVSDQARFSMSLIDLTLRRIAGGTSPFQFRFTYNYHSYPLPLNSHIITPICPKIMADEPKKTDVQPQHDSATTMLDVSESKDGKQNGSEKMPAAEIPPPPEKPLPGDCCGSGCVRCVWDVYYEELEEYKRLYQAN